MFRVRRTQVVELNASEATVEFTAGHSGQTQRGFLIMTEGSTAVQLTIIYTWCPEKRSVIK